MSMNLFRNLFLVSIAFLLMESCCKQNANDQSPDQTEVSDALIERYGITDKKHLSAASKRALKWPTYGNEWFIRFSEQPLKGDLAYEEGVVRRDPSAIIQHHDRYYVWYTKSTGPTQGFEGDIEKDKVFPWDRSDIWYATSLDGITWKEEGLAIPRGKKVNMMIVPYLQWKSCNGKACTIYVIKP